jgi:hypothetical protein
VWHQCDAIGGGGLSGSLNTALAANGADTLSVSDADAAGLGNAASETVHIDNVIPTVSLSAPATALSTAGAQNVAVAVNTGPSGSVNGHAEANGPYKITGGTGVYKHVSGGGHQTTILNGSDTVTKVVGTIKI